MAAVLFRMDVANGVIVNNSNGLSFRLQNLYQSGDMCDIQIIVGKQTFNAHKVILCASSDVFKTMLTNRHWTESSKQVIHLTEDRSCQAIFDRFLYYIYSGELFVSNSTVGPLLVLADKYNIQDLIPICRRYMLENLDAPVDNLRVLQWWEIANLQRDAELQEKTLKYIELNFGKIIQSTDFLNANINTIDALLSSSRLVIHNELMLFCALKQWLKTYLDCTSHHPFSDSNRRELKHIFHKLTFHIRWPMMTQAELEWLQDDHEMQQFISAYRQVLHLPHIGSEEFNYTSAIADTCPPASEFRDDRDIMAMCEEQQSAHSSKDDIDIQKSINLNSVTADDCPLCASGSNKRSSQKSRVYLSDYWSSSLTVSDFEDFPRYGSRTFFFSTPRTGFRHDTRTLDWEVEVYPKGVQYQPAILIGLGRDGNKVVDKSLLDIVRVSVMSRSPTELPVKVEVNILLRNTSHSQLFIEKCHRQVCIFDASSSRHNLDGIVPCEDLAMYLQPADRAHHLPDLAHIHVMPSLTLSLGIVIRPLT